ncbi:MAG TPA: DUF4328 domain-containing protein, partial [Isosphaeraceae bacterium]|nr:DUF4328 domain-containing protein [Isosphaeraceae bacterium]
MSKIHVLTPSGDETQFDEPHLRSMWEQGLLNPDAEYWKEGMADWAPLSEYFALNPEPIEDFAQPASPKKPGALTFQKNPQTLTAFLILMLWASLAFEVLSLFGDYAQLRLISGPFTEAEAEANDNRQSLIGVGYLVVFLVTAITFLKWIYRANLNSRGFGAQNMQFSPRGAVGYYFVPFVNLVRPYQAMKEIWQISHGPSHWQANPGSALLGWWWALWLISG